MISLSKPNIGFRERLAVDKVLRSGNLAQGLVVKKFEENFSEVVENRECIAVNSGTSALHLSLLSSGIGKGDEVIVPSFTFAATANSVALTGATPVFVDVEMDSFNISPESIESAITTRTRAIQLVHLFGLPANMKKILSIARKNHLMVFEDAAQAHLASIEGKPVGTFGTAATFSFYPTKNMTTGEGGIIVASSEEISRQCRLLRNQGMETRYFNEIVGFNLRMSEIHAAIGRVQLSKLPRWTRIRKRNANFYNQNLRDVIIPLAPEGYSHVYHQYTIRAPGLDREKLVLELERRGIRVGVYYPNPVHQLPSFRKKIDLPNTEVLSREVISLPIHPQLTTRDIEKVVEAVNKVVRVGT